MSGTNHSEIQSLIDISARLGRDPLLVQAGSGNTSVKLDGVLWIKASGKWLAHAAREEIFVPVDLDEIRYCIQCKRGFRRTVYESIGAQAGALDRDSHARRSSTGGDYPRSFRKHYCLGGSGRRTCASGRSACGPALAVDSVRGLGTATRSRGREDFFQFTRD